MIHRKNRWKFALHLAGVRIQSVRASEPQSRLLTEITKLHMSVIFLLYNIKIHALRIEGTQKIYYCFIANPAFILPLVHFFVSPYTYAIARIQM